MSRLGCVGAGLVLLLAAGCRSRAREDDEIFFLRDYTAGKTSFVESTKRHKGAWTEPGYRHTLLDVKGQGSLRHIWSTDETPGPHVDWSFYVDGEATPSIHGALPDLIRAAAALPACPAPLCALTDPPDHLDHNFYLPIPFEKGLRVEVTQRGEELGLFFAQLDYRLGDDRLEGARLEQDGEGEALRLNYRRWSPQPRALPAVETTTLAPVTVNPGQRVRLGELSGPAVGRALRLNAPLNDDLWIAFRYDDAPSDAVLVPLRDLFGNFDVGPMRRGDGQNGVFEVPFPFRSRLELWVENRGDTSARVSGAVDLEHTDEAPSGWGWLHGYHRDGPLTNGHRLHQVLYVRGRGHWLGMSLYDSGHDHGGGDFVVVDGESPRPAFLHGVNGEDYFGFAWFGKGNHLTYAASRGPARGRFRLHLENPYPFRESLHVEWGAFPDLSPRSVAWWYQDDPADTTVNPDSPTLGDSWDVFGPVRYEFGTPTDEAWATLPPLADLDAGRVYPLQLPREKFTSGWMQERSVGPSLNLTYTPRHHTPIKGERDLDGNGVAWLARQRVVSRSARTLRAWISFDDPVELRVGDRVLLREEEVQNGFVTREIELPLEAGVNELVVRLLNTYNRTFNWTGIGLHVVDEAGRPVQLSALRQADAPTAE